ncbi:MAG: tetratricopeptide repeat protein [Oligosphaeraceae bacterium]
MPLLLLHLLLLLGLCLPALDAQTIPAERRSPLPPLPKELQEEKELLLDYASVALQDLLAPEENPGSEKDGQVLMGILRRHPQAVPALERLFQLRLERGEEELLLEELRELNQGENPPLETQCALWDLLFYLEEPEAAPLLETIRRRAPENPQVLLRAIQFYHEQGEKEARDQAIALAVSLPDFPKDLSLNFLLLRIAAETRNTAMAAEAAQRITDDTQDLLLRDTDYADDFQDAWNYLWEARMYHPLSLILHPVLPLLWDILGTNDPKEFLQVTFYIALKAQDYTEAEEILRFFQDKMSPQLWNEALPDVLGVFPTVEMEDFAPFQRVPPAPFLKIQGDILESYLNSLPLLLRKDDYLRHLAKLGACVKDAPRIIRALRQLANPDLQDSLLLLDALMFAENLEEARLEMRRIQARFPGELDADFYFRQAYLEELAGEIDAAIQASQKVLERNPDFHEAANFLGYLYADHNIHLDLAEPLIQKALDADPGNPAYVDSLAWLRYRQGRPADALVLMARAFHSLFQDPEGELDSEMSLELLEHLQEILRALGAGRLADFLSVP